MSRRVRLLPVAALLTISYLWLSAANLAHGAEPTQVRVAAAISLREAIQEIASRVEHDSGRKVELSFGSSGQLLTQIRNGAPLDVFVSAAHEQIDALERDGAIPKGGRRVIARNSLVLIIPAHGEFNPERFERLTDPAMKRLAIGAPQTVPAGSYAQQVLQHLKLEESLGDRIIYGTNVRQVLDYVVRGEVTAGIVYSTDARSAGNDVKVVATADAAWHEPIEYAAVVVREGTEAREFLKALQAEPAQQTLERFGFGRGVAPASRPASAAAPVQKP